MKNLEREKYSDIIYQELNKLGTEFNRYKVRWEALAKHIRHIKSQVFNVKNLTFYYFENHLLFQYLSSTLKLVNI